MHVTICGKRYELIYTKMDNDDGRCDSPTTKNKKIRIDPRIKKKDQQHLETILHELLHAAIWSLDEEYVAAYSNDTARILCRLGFRFNDKEKPDSTSKNNSQ